MSTSDNNKLSYAAETHAGVVRDHNEDTFFADADLNLWFVADGMGGHQGGEVASDIARTTISENVRSGESLSDAIQKTHREIIASAERDEGFPGMGCTVVALQVDGQNYSVEWVGDSRAYLWNGNHLKRISRDHSFVQQLIDQGQISSKEASSHPKKNLITQALGVVDLETVVVDRVDGQFNRNDRILLCSDGLTDEVPDDQIESILRENSSEQDAVNNLLEAALNHGGSDNISIIYVSAPNDAEIVKPVANTKAAESKSTFQDMVFYMALGAIAAIAVIFMML
ncbi:MAG: Stp1/IreP family PP2C-type Ser/Thr phosphatase [Gammaproteobacteria bacterium]|nr:Stp1/IreP family PP2C-type Ser/Thr phosphatase [Gammaproteobacteria bacterium]NNJ91298.1 Stp1/IreP family PP2C-type Ser/Thr phosphatase [Gammaproteobacteria bacterium]